MEQMLKVNSYVIITVNNQLNMLSLFLNIIKSTRIVYFTKKQGEGEGFLESSQAAFKTFVEIDKWVSSLFGWQE